VLYYTFCNVYITIGSLLLFLKEIFADEPPGASCYQPHILTFSGKLSKIKIFYEIQRTNLISFPLQVIASSPSTLSVK
jgi:hypothetical protein